MICVSQMEKCGLKCVCKEGNKLEAGRREVAENKKILERPTTIPPVVCTVFLARASMVPIDQDTEVPGLL